MASTRRLHRRTRTSLSILTALAVIAASTVADAGPVAWCGAELDTTPLPGAGIGTDAVIDPAAGYLYLLFADAGAPAALHVVSLASQTLVATIDVPGRDAVVAAIDEQTHRVYVGAEDPVSEDASILVIDGDPGSASFLDIVEDVAIGLPLRGIAVDPGLGRLYTVQAENSSWDQFLRVRDALSPATILAEWIDGDPGTIFWPDRRGLAIDPTLHRLFFAPDGGGIRVLDLLSHAWLPSIPNADQIFQLHSVDPVGNVLYAVNYGLLGTGAIRTFDTVNLITDHVFNDATVSFTEYDAETDTILAGDSGAWFSVESNGGFIPSLLVPPTAGGSFSVGALVDATALDPSAGRLYGLGRTEGSDALRLETVTRRDDDADGLGQGCDNCPGDYNPDQADGDGDGAGDACDPDLDGDGCWNTNDQDPYSAVQQVGAWTSDSCNPRGGALYKTTAGHSDADGIRDCQDPDDDNDGIPDEADGCPTGPADCSEVRSCGLQTWWFTCLLGGCNEHFLRVIVGSNPDPTLVFENVEILNQTLWAKLAPGQTPAGVAAMLADANEPLIALELWEHTANGDAFRATVLSYAGRDGKLGDVATGGWLALLPIEEDGQPPRLEIESAWLAGAPSNVALPDFDGDALPDGYDSCLASAESPAVDSDADAFGNRCDADYDGDGRVTSLDGALFAAQLGNTCADPDFDADFDSNGDCAIDATDEALYTAQSGGPPGPSGLACPPGSGGVCDQELPACANGVDDDADGLADFPADPGCETASSTKENPKCDDDLDNDGDGKIDWSGAGGGIPADPQCVGKPWKDKEAAPACGFGAELALLLPVIAALRRRESAAP